MNSPHDKPAEKNKNGLLWPSRIKIILFCLILATGFVVSFLLPLRPSVSLSEKRALSALPAFSTQSLFNGSYFKAVDLWFSDTFPFRERIIAINSSVRGLYGRNTVQIQGDVEQGDDIPDVPVKTTAPATLPATTTQPPETTAETLTEPDNVTAQTFGAVLLVGDKAYEYYNFRTDMANRYAALVNKTAARLGTVNLYEMIVPNSTAITLTESRKNSINSSDQSKAIKYMYGLMDEKIKTVSVYDTLIAHNTEYVYFRTDHHWTALGAYYGYAEWAKTKGVEAVPLSKYEKVTYKGFLGSFYASTNKSAALSKNPDTVEVYKPFNSTGMSITDKKGKTFQWNVVTDVSKWDAGVKYSAFIGGDNPYSVIQNKDLTDGSSCLVVKESYANAFIPFLVPHYQTIHIVDYRYWNGNVFDFAAKHAVKDVFFINNISATRSEALIKQMEKLTG